MRCPLDGSHLEPERLKGFRVGVVFGWGLQKCMMEYIEKK